MAETLVNKIRNLKDFARGLEREVYDLRLTATIKEGLAFEISGRADQMLDLITKEQMKPKPIDGEEV